MAAARAEQRAAAAARPAAVPAGPSRRPAEARESAPADAARAGHAFGRVRLHPGPVPAFQARLTVSQPGDPFEQEAERVADEVMRASSAPPAVVQEPDGETVQTARDPSAENGPPATDDPRDAGAIVGVAVKGHEEDEELDERLPAPVELDAPAGDEAVQRAVRPDGRDEEEETEDEGEESLRRRAASGDDPPAETMAGFHAGGLARELASARAGGGRPLPAAERGSMERAFNADFSAVRIHDDPTAHRLSRSVHALAFTNREHIFFAPGRFDPGSGAGRRLLAHELTHVVQQVPSVRGGAQAPAPPAAASVQRTPAAEPGPVLVAGDGEQVQRAPGDGKPEYVMVARIYILDSGGNIVLESGLLMPEHPGAEGVHSASITGPPGKRTLSFAGLSIAIYKEPKGLGEALAKRGATISVTVFSSTPTGGGTADKDKDRDKKAAAGGKKGGKPGGTATSDKSGSKYGWLGLLDLDEDIIEVLESVFEALEDEEEYLALRETLEMLAELGTHASAVESWFSDTDKLLAIALGLEDNAAVTALEGWVNRAPTKRKLKATKPERKGIIAVAQKVTAIIEKVRRVLRPVFGIRASFVSLFGNVTALVEAMPVIQYLLDEENRGKADPSKLLAAFSDDLAATLHRKMEELRKGFAVKVEAFGADDLVTAEEIGRVVLSAGLKAVPGAGKLVVKIGTKIPGLEGMVADNLVAPLIPKAALDALNGSLVSLASLLEPAARQAASDLDAVFTGLEEELAAFLTKETGELSALLHAGAGGGRAARSEARFRGMMGASAGEALPEGVRREMEGHLGFDFGRVRIHRDGAAGRAADAVNANAFALGTDLFFGPGRYDPASPAGRRLLAHELTHVVQQDGAGGQVLQRDYKALREKLIRKVGNSVKDALKVAVGGSAARQTRAKEIRDNELEKLRGRKVVSATNPRLPEPYVYVAGPGGKITSIRRKLAWIRYVPSLTIDPGGRIKLGAEFNYDPKDADRAALRRACTCAAGRQAHHVLPLEVRDHPIAKLAEANGFKYNGLDNGVCLTERVHYGSHPKYTARVRGVLRALEVAHPGGTWTPALKAAFDKEVAALHAYCKSRRGKLE